ncbi:MAG: hypothetical protein FGF48_09850 [Candidatus Brockarchaeota archaeon]|nr:hypothetical protein [Candidatus Brockarchaeota archaeon]
MLSDEQIKAIIMLKLHKRGNWGSSHTAFENLKKGWKDADLGKQGLKRVEKLAEELIRQGLIISKPTYYGLQVSLNPRQHETIISFMKKFIQV